MFVFLVHVNLTTSRDEPLLIQFLTPRCTSRETAQVEEWAALDAANAAWSFEMERVWSLKKQLRFSQSEWMGAAYRRFAAAHPPKQFHHRFHLSVDDSRREPFSGSWSEINSKGELFYPVVS